MIDVRAPNDPDNWEDVKPDMSTSMMPPSTLPGSNMYCIMYSMLNTNNRTIFWAANFLSLYHAAGTRPGLTARAGRSQWSLP
eukprot:CAMPEP_0115703264 /NCGR_PEP_ID=MMETSP0272-20121206/69003_1 /TAXON_ID=71861 /ORGANISM="Scrippsiella trochoidea, Strain CCMP3099" /LENGTH=81 /DNA_ID=CAMNT_0003144111 /DNA_START=269 /DNA_END=511 /DNA_ORIENTATION=+